MTWYFAAILLFSMLLLFLCVGVPIAFSLGLTSAVGTVLLLGPDALIQLANTAFGQGSNNLFIVAPLFIFMAALLSYSGVAQQAFEAAYRWLNRLPGALASSSILACTVFASISGSSPATAATIGRIAMPEMLRHGYNKRMAAGVVAAGGTLGILIPPSVVMIIFGIITETSIGLLFIAGILPGLLISSLMILCTSTAAYIRPGLAPAGPEFTWGERFSSLKGLWGIILLFLLVIGSIYLGIATPAESAAIGAGGALLLALALRRLTWPQFIEALSSSAQTTAMLMFLIFSGFSLSFVISAFGIGQGLTGVLLTAGIGPWLVLIGYLVLLILLGTVVDPASMMVITLPIMFPVLVEMGFEPIWLGVLTTIAAEIGMITPPVGLNLFVLKGVSPEEVSMTDIIVGSLPYALLLVVGLIIMMVFPEIVLWLPSLSSAR